MSCSKIFSGDSPELTYKIIKYLQYDRSTLHSCILVNRLWCRLAIPLLWENPFSIPTPRHGYIDIYLNKLDSESRAKLNVYDDKLIFSDTLLFNYSSFIKYINIYKIILSVEAWVFFRITNRNSCIMFSGILNSVNDYKRLINKSLIKIFIDNGVNIHSLEIDIPYNFQSSIYYNDILELIIQNTNFIRGIRESKLYARDVCNSFYAQFAQAHYYDKEIDENTLIKNRISQVINLHQNLKRIILVNNKNYLLYQPILLSKDSNCSNTLNTIILYYIDFKDINNLYNIFEQLNVLEAVHIVYCYTLNTDFFKQIINLTKPFKLRSLFVKKETVIDQESLILLLQKSGIYLESFEWEFGINYKVLLTQIFLESIMEYCKNIKLLNLLCEHGSQIIYQILNLIENIEQNLNCLSIDISHISIVESIECSSLILLNLGQILPFKLEYLNLMLHISASNFELFLKKSKNTFIKRLLINNKNNEDDLLPYIKKYIMKERRIRYLAIKDYPYTILEVEKFRLCNIEVQDYDNSIMKVMV